MRDIQEGKIGEVAEQLDRREFGKHTLGALLTYSLLQTVFSSDAMADSIKPIAANWLAEVNQMSLDLKGNRLEQIEWQKQVEKLFSKVDLKEFLTFVDFKKLTTGIKFNDLGERSIRPKFPEVEGLPMKLVFGHQIFALSKGRSVVPHGHDNMATSFLILGGEFEGRHYDRLEDDRRFMIIKPTIDRNFTPGHYSTISDHKDNVHWFKATSETAFIFNIHVLNVDPENKKTGRVYIDPLGEKLADGTIKAPKLKASEAFKRFG